MATYYKPDNWDYFKPSPELNKYSPIDNTPPKIQENLYRTPSDIQYAKPQGYAGDSVLAKLKSTGKIQNATNNFTTNKNAFKSGINQTANKIGNTQVLGNTLKQYGGKIGGGAGVGLTIGNELQDTNEDLAVDGVSERRMQGRVLEGALRVGTKTAGAIAGAAQGAAIGSVVPFVGTTAGGLIGGTLGYVAPDLLISGTGKALNAVTGGKYALPSQQIDALRQTLQKNKQKNKAPKTEKAPNALDGTGAKQNDTEDNSADTGKDGSFQYDERTLDERSAIEMPFETINGTPPKTNEEDAGSNAQTVNQNSQAMVQEALSNLKDTLKNPAQADTLGGALSQKVANKQAETVANAQVKAADQLNNLATSSIGMRQGEQNLVKGEVDIDNAILNGEIAAQNAELAQAKGEQELSAGGLTMQEAQYKIAQQARMEKVANQLAAETDPVKQRALQSLLLTMQGKDPKPEYVFNEVGGGTDDQGRVLPKQLAVSNAFTGQVRMEGGQQAQPQVQYKAGQRMTGANGIEYEFDGKVWNPIS